MTINKTLIALALGLALAAVSKKESEATPVQDTKATGEDSDSCSNTEKQDD